MNIKHKLMNMRERLEAIPVGEVEEIPHNGKKWLRCHLINLANRNGMVIKTKVAGDNILVWRMR